MAVRLKRAYERAARQDGYRVLVDRRWPRGVKKRALALDDWLRDLGPSDALRKWFGHDPAKWRQFERRYRRELREQKQALELLKQKSRGHTVTLVYGARDEEHNEAVVLKAVLEGRK
jgi:uncharacterized protein YeaO (DUF488 family)